MKKKIKYKRIGRCKQCGICCMLVHHCVETPKKDKRDIRFRKSIGHKIIYETKKSIFFSDLNPCPHLSFNKNGKWICLIHKNKPKVCREFPSAPQDYHNIVKKFCGYKFIKVD